MSPAEDLSAKPAFRVPSMPEIRAVPFNGLNVASLFSGCGGSCLVEKLACSAPNIESQVNAAYRAFKKGGEYSEEQIERKRLSLEGVLVPLTAEENAGRLRAGGFRDVECFWRWMNFGAFVAVK